MKILIVDDDKDYLSLIGYILKSTECEADVVYVSNPRELDDVRVSKFDMCISGFAMEGEVVACDVFNYLQDHEFKGRFIIASMSPKKKIYDKMFINGADRVEVIEKGRSSSLRHILKEFSGIESTLAYST